MTAQDEHPPIHLLLVEDDAVSRSFLEEALRQFPARVDAAEDIAQSLRFARRSLHSLCLVDVHLPDGDGVACLRALREVTHAPALAITAGASRNELDALCAAGFSEVLMKPVSVAILHGTVRRLLHGTASIVAQGGGKTAVWDEAHALAAVGGKLDSLLALRQMFLAELPLQCSQLAQGHASQDGAVIAALLHKLKASCRFVGATRLAGCVDALALAPLDSAALLAFQHAAQDAIHAAALSRPDVA